MLEPTIPGAESTANYIIGKVKHSFITVIRSIVLTTKCLLHIHEQNQSHMHINSRSP